MMAEREAGIPDFPTFQTQNPIAAEDITALSQVIQVMRFLYTYGAWENSQTHLSLAPFAIEEAYEFYEAVVNEDISEIVSELGDLLLQVLIHAVIGEQTREFTLRDIAQALNQKLQQRSAPMFSGKTLSIVEQDAYWQSQKIPRQASVEQIFAGVKLSGSVWQRTQRIIQYLISLGFPLPIVPNEIRFVDLGCMEEEILQENLHNFMQEITRLVREYGKIPQSSAEWGEILGLTSEDYA